MGPVPTVVSAANLAGRLKALGVALLAIFEADHVAHVGEFAAHHRPQCRWTPLAAREICAHVLHLPVLPPLALRPGRARQRGNDIAFLPARNLQFVGQFVADVLVFHHPGLSHHRRIGIR